MKVADLFETDEFTNQEITIDHLYRVQAARCHELRVLFMRLLQKYPQLNWQPMFLGDDIELDTAKQCDYFFIGDTEDDQNDRETLSVPEINKFNKTCERTLVAKIAYEKAGGQYQHANGIRK